MGRQQNYSIGRKGEGRIKGILKDYGLVLENMRTLYPDFIFVKKGKSYAVECKTVKGVHDGNKVGRAKISITEYHGYNSLIVEERLIPCVIIEIRPKGTRERDYIYFFVEWQKVKTFFEKTNPKQSSLTLWWIIRNGINLNWWLKNET